MNDQRVAVDNARRLLAESACPVRPEPGGPHDRAGAHAPGGHRRAPGGGRRPQPRHRRHAALVHGHDRAVPGDDFGVGAAGHRHGAAVAAHGLRGPVQGQGGHGPRARDDERRVRRRRRSPATSTRSSSPCSASRRRKREVFDGERHRARSARRSTPRWWDRRSSGPAELERQAIARPTGPLGVRPSEWWDLMTVKVDRYGDRRAAPGDRRRPGRRRPGGAGPHRAGAVRDRRHRADRPVGSRRGGHRAGAEPPHAGAHRPRLPIGPRTTCPGSSTRCRTSAATALGPAAADRGQHRGRGGRAGRGVQLGAAGRRRTSPSTRRSCAATWPRCS